MTMKMQPLNILSFIILITYHSTNALPDTNVHIQHYDGPVYISTPKPDCCPFCNSPIKPGCLDNTNPTIDVRTPEIIYPETTIYIKPCDTEDKKEVEKSCGKSSRDCYSPTENTSYTSYGKHVTDNSKVSGTTMLHTNTKGVHKIPVTCTDTQAISYGNSYPGTETSLATHFGYDTYGTGIRPCVATEPLSSYLPITASQNNCCQVPMLTYNSDQGHQTEPTLIPQKFMYSLILDGDVASNQNGYNSMYSYC